MDYFNGITAVATAVGVILVFVQLLSNNKIERTKFENELVIRYIAITNEITFNVMYLKPCTEKFEEIIGEKLHGFYKYFDLSNQELFLMADDRVSEETWVEWESGIIDLLKLKSFQYAWNRISSTVPDNTFTQLRLFIGKNKELLGM